MAKKVSTPTSPLPNGSRRCRVTRALARVAAHPSLVLNRIVHNRFVAMAVVAFSVSWGFHVVEKRADEKIKQEQRVLSCVIETTADLQGRIPHLNLRGILAECEIKERS